MPIIRYVKQDILETELNYIAHGVNLQNTMGSGVAKVLYTKFPLVKKEYHKLFELTLPTLGDIQIVKVTPNISVINCFTQEYFGYNGKRYVNYGAIGRCFSLIDNNLSITDIAIPKIGAGLAGGDWKIISEIINICCKRVNVHVYSLEDL